MWPTLKMAADSTVGDSNLHVGDLVVIVGYFAFVLFVGLWVSRTMGKHVTLLMGKL